MYNLEENYKKKIEFVAELSKAVGGRVSGIESLDYVVAKHKLKGYAQEYVVVYYKGGAVQARNCNMNSNAAILGEVAKMTYSSQVYGEDTACYNRLISDDVQYDFDIYNIESI
jgi:hypothetical protein